MRRKLFTQLSSAQTKLGQLQHVVASRAKRAAHDGDMVILHEAIARGWRLEQQAQVIRQELYHRRRNRPNFVRSSVPKVLDDCLVTLRHGTSIRTIRFSTLLTTNVATGLIGLDTMLGQVLQSSQLMSLVALPTPLGEKTYQIVAINKLSINRQREHSQGAKDHSAGTYMNEA